MIRIKNIKIPVENNNLEKISLKASEILNLDNKKIEKIIINKMSIDARKKSNIFFVYEIDVKIKNEDSILRKNKNNNVLKTPNEKYEFQILGNNKMKNRPVIVGSGPAGLFCAYMLAKNGYNPIIIEKGEDIDNRCKSVNNFFKNNKLNLNSNVVFGEGGAGTFSDGKLNTQIKDKKFRIKEMLDIFVECGAPDNIKYFKNPHIGTDVLKEVIKNLRKKIISFNAEFRFNSCLESINIKNNKINSIVVNGEKIPCDVLILAIGHSAKDTFKMLYEKGMLMKSKPFAVGIRISHKQDMINESQYGNKYKKMLPAASYKLTYNSNDNHGVYTFCMCPGGYVINSTSEKDSLVINGMSYHKRNSENANSAIIVTVSEKDYGYNVFDGLKFQSKLEKKAYEVGNGKIPVQLYKDYKKNTLSDKYGLVKPLFKGDVTFANINEIFPKSINKNIKEAIEYFGTKIVGFNDDDAIIAAVESRTSSPIKIIRNELGESNFKGIFLAGEGAGYSGGITSSAVDGIKIAENIAKIYKN